MKAILIAVGAAVMLNGCATAPRTDVSTAAAATSAAAMAYMDTAHSSNMFEVESSRLALQTSQNPVVRSFAQTMMTDHTRMMQEMMPMHGKPSMQMMSQHRAMMERLRGASAATFNRIYHQEQVMAHQQALDLHRRYAATGDHPALRALASRAVPVIERHLNELQTHQAHMSQ